MAKCFMCGASITQGILCEKCDKPRRPKQQDAPKNVAPPPAAASVPSAPSVPPQRSAQATAPAVELDPFPKAPVLAFPIESASLAITSVVNLLVVAGVPSLLVAADRAVKFVSDEAKKLFDASQQELSSLKFIETKTGIRIGELSVPATAVVHNVANNFRPFADLKGIHLQVDVQELDERFRDHEHLYEALSVLMDNAMHYVPAGGQVVIGVRWMEHKNKPLLLFFVMDNGPLVPEHLRGSIFEPDFVWIPQSSERTGRSLFKAREFAVAHSGSLW